MEQTIAETERLVVRPWRLEEAPVVLDILGRPEVCRWLGNTPVIEDLDQARRKIRSFHERSLSSPLGYWSVVPRATGVPVGSVLLCDLPHGAGEVEIGWWLHPDAHGYGYATEAAAAALDHGFRNGLPEIYAVTHLDNAASQAVCGRLRMTDLGEVQRWYDGASRVFRITRPTWASRRDRS